MYKQCQNNQNERSFSYQLVKFGKTSDIKVAGVTMPFSKTLRILGHTISEYLSFDAHVGKIVKAANYHVRSLRHVRRFIAWNLTNTVVCSLISKTKRLLQHHPLRSIESKHATPSVPRMPQHEWYAMLHTGQPLRTCLSHYIGYR